MTRLKEIEGVGGAFEEKLKAIGVSSIENLLEMGKTPKGRVDLAEKANISEKLILKWVNRADLIRVKGVGSEYADLLEASGVDTVPELSHRLAENLLKKMTEVNMEKKLVRQLPVLKQVESWVSQAKNLPRVIKY
jgi:predicted flap endonuclease-1-like 5' DNA nuclease